MKMKKRQVFFRSTSREALWRPTDHFYDLQNGSEGMGTSLADAITRIEAEMEKMSPNMKAIEK